jgi:hypothetical protein
MILASPVVAVASAPCARCSAIVQLLRSSQHPWRVQSVVATPGCWSDRSCFSKVFAGSSSRGSCETGCRPHGRRLRGLRPIIRTGRCPWGSTRAAGHGVLVRRSPPGRVRVGREHPRPSLEGELSMAGELFPAVPGEGLRGCRGSFVIDAVSATFIATVPKPPSDGPFFTGGFSAQPSSRGRCTCSVDRLLSSTSVPIADRRVPPTRSPSQCPGSARSSASAGRSLSATSA